MIAALLLAAQILTSTVVHQDGREVMSSHVVEATEPDEIRIRTPRGTERIIRVGPGQTRITVAADSDVILVEPD